MSVGGFVLSYDIPALRDLFTHKKDLLLVNSEEEAIECIDYYTQHLEEYNQIKVNAQNVVQNHTYKHRAQEIIQTIY